MWQLWIKAHARAPDGSESKWKHGGGFDSISLATRQIIQLEKLDSPTLELLVTVWTEFMDDDDAISHYTHTTPLCKYAIRKRDPKPKKGIV